MTTEPKHTPGPWRTGDRFNTVFGPPNGNPSPQTIATISRGNEANARLISAAPALLALAQNIEIQVKAIRDLVRGTSPKVHDALSALFNQARAAIALVEKGEA
jgi:hypothetical protein